MLEVQRKTGVKNTLLTRKILRLKDVSEKKDAIIGEYQAKGAIPPESNQKLENIIERKNVIIKDLKYELMRVSKAHDDLLYAYEEKLLKYGIPKSELGFIPMSVVPECSTGIGRGAAGLVTKNK